MSSIVLPRTDEEGNYYVSYSQLSTWKRSKREYIRQYFFGERFKGNAYTEFGSKVGEALEDNDFSGFTKEEEKFLKTIPRLDEFEREIKLYCCNKAFYVKGFIDSNKSSFETLLDYKTGDIESKTEEYESSDYRQLQIYAAALEQETGVLPKEAYVVLIGRTGNAFKREKLKLGTKYSKINKDVSPSSIKGTIEWVETLTKEISDCYKVFLELTSNES